MGLERMEIGRDYDAPRSSSKSDIDSRIVAAIGAFYQLSFPYFRSRFIADANLVEERPFQGRDMFAFFPVVPPR